MPPGQYRSRGEAHVASALNHAGLSYRYEPRLVLPTPTYWTGLSSEFKGQEKGARTTPIRVPGTHRTDPPATNHPGAAVYWTRPDFYLPQHHAVIEYAGRMDLPGYRQRHSEKVKLYAYNHIDCYEVFPQDLQRPYWAPRLIDAIKAALPSASNRRHRGMGTIEDRVRNRDPY